MLPTIEQINKKRYKIAVKGNLVGFDFFQPKFKNQVNPECIPIICCGFIFPEGLIDGVQILGFNKIQNLRSSGEKMV